MDNAELLMHINKHCPNPLTNLLPKEPTTNERAKALKKFIEGIAEEVGGAITTEGALEKALTKNSDELRSCLIRALCGGVHSAALWRCSPGGPIRVAQDVFNEACGSFDSSMIARWVANSGRFKRKANTVQILQGHDKSRKTK